MKSRSLNLLEHSGPVRGLYRDCFTFTFTVYTKGDVTYKVYVINFTILGGILYFDVLKRRLVVQKDIAHILSVKRNLYSANKYSSKGYWKRFS